MTTRARLLSGLLTAGVAVGALTFMITTGLEEGLARAVMANEMASSPSQYEGERTSVNGFVVNGSMRQTPDLKLIRFQVWAGGEPTDVINVEFGKILPDTVKDGGKVQATGHLRKRGEGRYVFEANDVVGKCPTKYDPLQQQVQVPSFDKNTAVDVP